MKRIITIIPATLMALPLVACSSALKVYGEGDFNVAQALFEALPESYQDNVMAK